MDLPAWALAYGVFAVMVLVGLWSRSRFVGAATEPPSIPHPGAAPRIVRVGRRLCQIVLSLLLTALIAVALLGRSEIGLNIAPIATIGVYVSLGGWVSLVAGRFWAATDPFLLAAAWQERRGSRHPVDHVMPWWSGAAVFASFVVIWIAWINGDAPRNLAVWLCAYVVAMIAVTVWGGRDALRRANALPAVLDFAATILRRPAREAAVTPDDRRATRLLAAMALAAVGSNRFTAASWYIDHIETRGELTETVVNIVIIAALSGGIVRLWHVVERRVERARNEPESLSLAPMLAPIAGGVLLAAGLRVGVVQFENFVVLTSDPFSRGWDLFGTITWQIWQQPLSPMVGGISQAGVLLAGHVAALIGVGRASTVTAVGVVSTFRFRQHCWMAALPAMALVTASGIVWTLVLLGN